MDAGTPIYRIESRLVAPTRRNPDPSREEIPGRSIISTLMNENFMRSNRRMRQPGGVVGVHWSTNKDVPTNYDFDELSSETQTGVPMSRRDRRQMQRSPEREGPFNPNHKTYSDYSGAAVDLRPYTARVMWHGTLAEPERAQKTQYTWEHELDLEEGSVVPVHAFSFSIPSHGQPHMSHQFKTVQLPEPINMTVTRNRNLAIDTALKRAFPR